MSDSKIILRAKAEMGQQVPDAWLAAHPKKIVIAPGFEKRDGVMWWGFDGLLPDRWIKL